jgi:hypothetical protein
MHTIVLLQIFSIKRFYNSGSHRMYLKINQPNNIFLHSTKSLADKLLNRLSFRCTRRIRGGLHTIKKDYSTCNTACTAQHLDQLEHLLFLHSNQNSLHCRHLKIKYPYSACGFHARSSTPFVHCTATLLELISLRLLAVCSCVHGSRP